MKECKILKFVDNQVQELEPSNAIFGSNQESFLYDFPADEAVLNEYLRAGWTVKPVGYTPANAMVYYLERER